MNPPNHPLLGPPVPLPPLMMPSAPPPGPVAPCAPKVVVHPPTAAAALDDARQPTGIPWLDGDADAASALAKLAMARMEMAALLREIDTRAARLCPLLPLLAESPIATALGWQPMAAQRFLDLLAQARAAVVPE